MIRRGRIMGEISQNPPGWFRVHRFLFLLVSMVLLLVLYPFVEDCIGISFLMDIFFSMVLLSGIYAVSERKWFVVFALLTALPSFFAGWCNHFLKIPSLFLIYEICSALFFGFAAIIIIRHLFRENEITADLIIGAICGYLLIGLMWGCIYSLLEAMQPGSFHLGQQVESDGSFFYFSFVTLTTTGYGDIIPLTGQAQSLSTLEAIMGQIYIAVNIATLVAMRISQSSNRNF